MNKDVPYIELHLYGYTYRTELVHNDISAEELKAVFARLMVCATYPLTVLEDWEGGSWQWVGGDEKAVKNDSAEE